MNFLSALRAGVREYVRVRGLYLHDRRKQAVERYESTHNEDGTKKEVPAVKSE